MMCYSFVGAIPLGLCVNHEYQISAKHVDPTGKEKTRMPSRSPPALPLLLEENLRIWRGSRRALGWASEVPWLWLMRGQGFLPRWQSMWLLQPVCGLGHPHQLLSCPKLCSSPEQLPGTETLLVDIESHLVCPVVYTQSHWKNIWRHETWPDLLNPSSHLGCFSCSQTRPGREGMHIWFRDFITLALFLCFT